MLNATTHAILVDLGQVHEDGPHFLVKLDVLHVLDYFFNWESILVHNYEYFVRSDHVVN